MTEEQTQALAVQEKSRSPVAFSDRGITVATLDDLVRFSGIVADSGLAPKGLQSRQAIVVAIQMGMEVGLTPMAALQNIAVINGRPSIWGDAQLAVCRATGELEKFEEWFEQNSQRLPRNPASYDDRTCAVCRVQRRGYPAAETSFSVEDAKRANLWNKEGPWKQYPGRMLKYRARSFALRDQFGDALKGLKSAEEAQDLPAIDVETVEPRKPAVLVADIPNEPKVDPRMQDPEADFAPMPHKPEPPPVAEPVKAPEAELTPTERLGALLKEWGHSFDTLVKWCKHTGNYEAADTCPSLDEFPVEIAARLIKAKVGLKRGLDQVSTAKVS